MEIYGTIIGIMGTAVFFKSMLCSGWEGVKELGVSIFPIHSLINGEPRGYESSFRSI